MTLTTGRGAATGSDDGAPTPEAPVATARDRRPGRYAALAGIASGGLALGVGTLIAHLIGPGGSPVPAVSELILRLLPGGLINAGKDVLGAADKPVLNVLVLLGALALAALAGRLGLTSTTRGLVAISVVSALPTLAVLLAPDTAPSDLVGCLAGWVVGMIALRALLRRTPGAKDAPTTVDRRRFLAVAGLTGGAAVLAGAGTKVLPGYGTGGSGQGLTLPKPAVAATIPPGVDFDVPGLSPYLTPADSFYRIDTAFVVPRVKLEDWRLTVTGMVNKPITLTMADVLARPLEEHTISLTCVSNPVGGDLAGNATWLGLRLHTLLAEAEPLDGADMVLSRSVDDFTAGSPLEVLTDPDRACLLAVGMNGAPLPAQHGFPARLVVPGLYGYVSATKWVTELKVTTFAADEGYWTPLGWSPKGPIKLSSRIDTPTAATDAGTVVIAGVAWAQHTGISKVQVRLDDRDWVDAELANVTGPDTWRQWRLEADLTPGDHVAVVRATDADGVVQDEAERDVIPDGATGLHRRTISVR